MTETLLYRNIVMVALPAQEAVVKGRSHKPLLLDNYAHSKPVIKVRGN